jgi:hypothetical protein
MDDRNHLLPPPLDIFYPDKPRHQRTLVSASRVFNALRRRLGCVPTGERGTGGEYWLTPKGVRFPVKDPVISHDRQSAFTAPGQRPLYYAYDYAHALLAYASWLVAHAVPAVPELTPPLSTADLLLEEPPLAQRPPAHELPETIFV